jgi:Cu/Ag efflux pump CusA
MVGGMITAPLLSMLVIPEVFRLLALRRLRRAQRAKVTLHAHPEGN